MPKAVPELIPNIDSIFDSFIQDAADLLREQNADELPNILDFIEDEIDLGGIQLTVQQNLILKLLYNLPKTEEDISILEYWKSLGRSTWDASEKYQTLVVNAGRRSGKCDNIFSLSQTSKLGLIYMHEFLDGNKCMSINQRSLLITESKGLREQIKLANSLELIPEQTIPINEYVAIEGQQKAALAAGFYVKGVQKTKKITTQCGYELEGTPEHRIKVLDQNGVIKWRYLGDIRPGDRACIHRSTRMWPENEIEVAAYIEPKSPTAREFLNFPRTLNADWGYLIGLLVANGTWTTKGVIESSFHKLDKHIYEQAYKNVGIKESFLDYDSRSTWGAKLSFYSTHLRSFLNNLGWVINSKPHTKATPWSIRRSPKHVVAAYLSGLFDGDGAVEKDGKAVTFSTASETLSIETQLLLLNFGIVCRRKPKVINGKTYYLISLRGQRSVKRFISEIGFRLERKQNLVLNNLESVSRDGGDTEKIPYQIEWLKKLREVLPINLGRQPESLLALTSSVSNLDIPSRRLDNLRTEYRAIVGNAIKTGASEEFSGYRLAKLLSFARRHCQAAPDAIKHFEYLAECDYFYDEIKSVKDSEAYCVDLHVPGPEQYVCQGFTNHNSSLASIICAFEFYCLCRLKSPQAYYGIANSSPIGILVLATTADQAKRTIFRAVTGVINNCAYFKRLKEEGKLFVGKEEISYEDKLLYLYSGNSKSAAQVGATLKCLVMDEVSRFLDADGESNALELWSNLGISAAPFKDKAIKVAISSAWYEGDAIQRLYDSTKTDPTAVGITARSWDLNPIHAARDNPVVASEYNRDPIKAAIEFEGICPSAIDAFFNIEEVKAAFTGTLAIDAVPYTTQGTLPLVCLALNNIIPYRETTSVAHIDPAVKSDSYALVVGHTEENAEKGSICIIDSIVAWEPQHDAQVSFSDVYDFLTKVNWHRPIRKVTADHYNSVETLQRLNMSGIRAEMVYFSNRIQVQMYDLVRQLLHEGRLILPAQFRWKPLVLREFAKVQLIKGQKINHQKDSSKDCVDGIAAVCWELMSKTHLQGANTAPKVIRTVKKPIQTESQSPRQQVMHSINRSRKQWLSQEMYNRK